MQQGMLLHSLDEKGTYVQQMVCSLKEDIDIAAFRRAWQQVMDRHAILRSSFRWADLDEPLQQVHVGIQCPFVNEDWSELDAESQETALKSYLETDRRSGFDVTAPPLMRVALFRFAGDDYRAVWSFHHALLDGRSHFLVLKEVFDLYDANRAGEKLELERPRPYSEYIAWLVEQDVTKAEEFWRKKFSGFSEPTVVAKRAHETSHKLHQADLRHTSEQVRLDENVAGRLRDLAARCGVTLNNFMQGGWALMLSRYTGEEDISFGAARAGRHWTAEDASSRIGMFVNTLPMRVNAQADQSLSSWLKNLRSQHVDLRDYEHTPLTKIQEWSELPPGTALFDTVLVFENYQMSERFRSLGGNWLHREIKLLEQTSYPLVFTAFAGSDIVLDLEYDNRIFERPQIERMLGHLRTLLESMADGDEQRIGDISMISDDERRQLLVEWNETSATYPKDKCIHQLFEASANETPEAIALSFGDQQLTYLELNRRANQLAHYLLEQGTKPADLIGIFSERSIEMVVGILGILKAGGTYVPLDPNYPSERLNYILNDTGLRMVLTQGGISQQLPTQCDQVISIDSDWERIGQMSGENPACTIKSDNAAYVIYTSGSTGTPKGVLISHRSLVNHSFAVTKLYELQPADRILQFASFNFDVAAEEIFPTLLCGAAVVLLTPEAHGSLDVFSDFLDREKITVVNLPASHWRQWSISLNGSNLPAGIRLVVTGSERVLPEDYNSWRKTAGKNVRWLNAYGLTETTITSLVFDPPHADSDLTTVPVGRPVSNTEVYLLDKNLQPVPAGIPGHLYIGGDCLALGYLNRPDLTAEKFVPHPFSSEPDARLYKTGDLARYLPNGEIEYLDRIDNQIKIRGFRIEPGEIESVLAGHPELSEAVVVAREEKAGDPSLVAYVVPDKNGAKAKSRKLEMWPSVGEYPVYDDLMYYAMSTDVPRTTAYETAITQLVKDKIVVEIGTGKDVILARFCISAGAKKVYAIEAGEQAYSGAKALVESLGLSDKITIIKGFSFDVNLPEKADVCVSEIIGTIGGSEGATQILNDAWRFLKKTGRMIPERCITRIAVAQLPDDFSESPHFSTLSGEYAEKVFRQVGYEFDVRVCFRHFPEGNIISDAGVFEDLDFSGQIEPEWSRETVLEFTKSGRFDGFLLWVNLNTAGDILIDTLNQETSWLPVYLPIFDPGIEVEPGDVVKAVIRSSICENGFNPDYSIAGELHRRNGEIVSFTYDSYHHRPSLNKTPFYQRLFSAGKAVTNGTGSTGVSDANLRNYLSDFLPNYMIPTAFVELDELPLMPNGKIDRKALPDPGRRKSAAGEQRVAPRNETEKKLTTIWSDILNTDDVGVFDNFFDLGGHSLHAIRMLTRVSHEIGFSIPINQLFRTPRIAELASLVAGQTGTDNGATAAPIDPVSRTGDLPLSSGQQRLWFLDQLSPNNAAYIMSLGMRIKGNLDPAILKASLEVLVNRQESLRTTIQSADGRPFLKIDERIEIPLALHDLSPLPDAAREEHALEIATQDACRSFQLDRGPLFRTSLTRLRDGEHILFLAIHHIISDGWSLTIFFNELSEIYASKLNGRPLQLQELPIQFADFAARRQTEPDRTSADSDLKYWANRLRGVPEFLELPTDFVRPPVQQHQGRKFTVDLSGELLSALKELSRSEGSTLYMILLAAFQTFLHRHAGQEDIVVGSPIANRTHFETENLIGLFANTLVMRADFSADPTFLELLTQVRKNTIEALDHQDIPFEKLVDELKPKRSLSYNPIFQVLFGLHNLAEPDPDLPGTTFTTFEVDKGASRFDLSLDLTEHPGGISVRVEYDTALFKESTMAEWMVRFETLLEGIVRQPSLKISQLPIISEREKQEIVHGWERKLEWNDEYCIHQMFAAFADESPNAPAVSCDGQVLTYAELEQRANKLARYLRSIGVKPGSRIAVFTERSIEMVVALLGVLKAGAAYVPIDPIYPSERIAFMLEDAAIDVAVTVGALKERLNETKVRTVCLDLDAANIEKEPPERLPDRPDGESLAYIIYTSGSTGKPKGVQVKHNSVTHLILAGKSIFGFDNGEVWTTFHSHAFDLSVWEIWTPLALGAKLVIVPRSMTQAPNEFFALLRDEKVTILNQTPSAMGQLVNYRSSLNDGAGKELNLRIVFCGGEALPNTIAEKILEWDVPLWNLYGPTEATVWSSIKKVGAEDLQYNSIPIGRPLPDVEMYVLDAHLNPVPQGVPGELHIAGDGLAVGYLNRPELTAERFVRNPFSGEKGARLYRTGDLARHLPSGEIEYLGRIDHQVKIRGFRIELGEIESVIGQYEDVREAVVQVLGDGDADKRLVAYVVSGTGSEIKTADLREYLKLKLPEYMVPTAYVRLERIPLTSNGKVDRKALPIPERDRSGAGEGYEAPKNETQEKLAKIWSDVLEVDKVGVKDSFFDLGGHSLLAIRMLTTVSHEFGVSISVGSLFNAPQIEDVANLIRSQLAEYGREDRPPAMNAVARSETLPLSFSQQQLWFLDKLNPNSFTYNIPLVIRLSGSLDRKLLKDALSAVVERQEALRISIGSKDRTPFLKFAPPSEVELPVTDLTEMSDRESEAEMLRLAAEAIRAPFDLEKGPLFKASLIGVKDDEHVLVVNIHHIIGDGWSLTVFLEELGAIYTSFVKGQPAALQSLPIQFADYASWQQENLKGEVLDKNLRYWKGQLAGAPALLEIPADRPRPATQRNLGAHYPIKLSYELSDNLKELARKEGATPFMTLLAAFQALLYRYTGQEDIVVGSPSANRSHKETEGLIGFFVNMLALRIDLSGDPTFRELMQRVKTMTADAYDNQNAPFEKIVEMLNPERDLSYNPIFQVSFDLQTKPDPKLALPGLNLSFVEVESGVSKFDLAVALQDGADGISGTIEYDTDLFDEKTIALFADSFKTLLDSVSGDPDQYISRAPILTDAERHKILYQWNGDRPEVSTDRLIHQLFEEQVERRPDAIAVSFGNEHVTYRELNSRANRLTHHLLTFSVGPDVPIAICIDRSVEMIVSILAVLKAGGMYVPLDPSYPDERLAYVLADCGANLVIAQKDLAKRLKRLAPRATVLDPASQPKGKELDGNIAAAGTASDLAYVIYTSGSTGNPKGVMVMHKNVVRLLRSTEHWFGFDETDVWTLFHSFAFDFSVWEIWGALAYGGRLVVVPYRVSRSPGDFHNLLCEEGVTVLNQTPSAFRLLIDCKEAADPRNRLALRYVIFGGEALDFGSLRPWIDRHGAMSPRLINMYGITETTVHVTFRELSESDIFQANGSLIGQPIPDLGLYILDRHMQPVPKGVPGEMYVAGAGLARGYLNRPELTEERFVGNPFAAGDHARLYRTGDRARYTADGEIEYLGRVDNQVKIRGFRIELGEIESAIGGFRDVREAIVQVVGDGNDKRLAAYVVSATASEIRTADLRKYLRDKLPEYMVPADYVQLERIPLTPNGKVDRKALPVPERDRSGAGERHVPPRNETEEKLAAIWSEVLGVDNIGIKDGFFDLGGHSLLAIRMFSMIEETFRKNVPLATLFEAGTIEKLAGILNQEDWQEPESSLVPIQPNGTKPPFFGIHAGGGNVLFYRDLARYLGTDQPFYGIQARRLAGRQVGHATIEEMAEFYIREMKSVQPVGPYYVGGSSFGGLGAYEIAQQLLRNGDEVGIVALFDTGTPDYPQMLPTTNVFRSKVYELFRRYQHHRDSLAAFDLADKKIYIFSRLAKVKLRYRRKFVNLYKNIMRRMYQNMRSKRSLPSSYIQIEDQIKKAHAMYQPRVYSGKMTLFRASNQPLGIQPDETLGWGELVAGGIEIYEVPGHHGSVVSEPYVGVLAEKLAACIDRTLMAKEEKGHAAAVGAADNR